MVDQPIDLLHIVIVCDEDCTGCCDYGDECSPDDFKVDMDDVYAMVKLQNHELSKPYGTSKISTRTESVASFTKDVKEAGAQQLRQRTAFMSYEMHQENYYDQTVQEMYLTVAQFGSHAKMIKTDEP